MLLIQRIEIDNFVCFDKLAIEPSSDPKKPLTVIRAENGSGKTTLLRAIRWGMYGERSLPGNARHFSLHPAAWRPDKQGIQTMVSILFETDGSSREHLAGTPRNTVFELRRTVKTVAMVPSRAGDPDFRRIDEQAHLMQQQPDGSWNPHDAGVDAVIGELLPWELRDFFVMDADEAADYVGGSENKVLQRREVVAKTTYAVGALLGLDIFQKTTSRLAKISDEFGRAATKAIGDKELSEKQEELERHRREYAKLDERLKLNREQKADIQGQLDQARGRLEALVGNIQAHDELNRRLKENRQAFQKTDKRRQRALETLGARVVNSRLLGSLAAREVGYVRDQLQPLYDDGSIPVRHLEFVQGLLDRGKCVCGQVLTMENDYGRRVRESVTQSSGRKEKANWLAHVLHAADALHLLQRWDGMGCRLRGTGK